jgi:DNA-binding transcriptional ArsR family regulator
MGVMTESVAQLKLAANVDLDRAAELLKALAHVHRLRMLQLLVRDRYTVGELAEACGLPSHMASEHLRLMQRSGLLTRHKEGRRVYYQIAQPRLANHIIACIESRPEDRSI